MINTCILFTTVYSPNNNNYKLTLLGIIYCKVYAEKCPLAGEKRVFAPAPFWQHPAPFLQHHALF